MMYAPSLSTLVGHQGSPLDAIDKKRVHTSNVSPPNVKGKMHFMPELGPDVVKHSSAKGVTITALILRKNNTTESIKIAFRWLQEMSLNLA